MSEGLKQHIKQKAPFKSEAQVALLNLLVASAHVRQMIERACNARGISHNHYNVLRILRGAPEPGYARAEIIDRMIDRGSDVTRLMDRLVKIGLVSRKKCLEDRRRSLHTITDKGLSMLVEMEPDILEIHHAFAARVNEKDLRELSRICEGIYQAVAEAVNGS